VSGASPAAPATWQIDSVGAGEVVSQSGTELAGQLAQPRIGTVLGTEPEYGLDKPALTLSVTRVGVNTLVYRLGPTGKEGYAVLKSSARPEHFRLPGYTAEALSEAASRAQLVQTAPAPAPADATPADQAPAGGQPGASPVVEGATEPGAS